MSADDPLVFVYGTLTDPDHVDALLDDWRFAAEAVLVGCHRVVGTHPTLAPGGHATGRLLVTRELERLDAYEGVNADLYVRVAVPIEGGGRAWVYIGDPERLDAPAHWPGEGSFEARVRQHVDAAGVTVRRERNR